MIDSKMKKVNEKAEFLWHYNVHKKFGENLLYLMFSFVPVYRREEIISSLEKFIMERSISSYCIYEIFGYYDIMLRIWIPSFQHPSTFIKELERKLEAVDCIRGLPFYVEDNHYHWMWWNYRESAELFSPDDEDIDKLSEDIVKAVDSNTIHPSEFAELENHHILKRYEPKEGIKFFVMIPPPPLAVSPTFSYRENVERELVSLVIKHKDIIEPSIYFGTGFAWFIIKGKIPSTSYSELNNLIQEINKIGIIGFQIRTYTYLVCEVVAENEGIALPLGAVEEKERDITHYLTCEENERFEIKGSLLFNIDRFLRDKEYKGEPDERIAIEGVLKSIVGLLNADGGKILIGVIEAYRYGDLLKNPNNLLHKLPRIDNRIVFGIEKEYVQKDWDAFCRRLSDLIRTHIGKEASAIVNFQRHQYQGKDLCLVDVKKGRSWYYLDKNRFYVRRANSTILLEGREADSYKMLYPKN